MARFEMTRNTSLGGLVAYEQTKQGLHITAENAFAEITVFSPRVIRIHIYNEAHPREAFSHTVVACPAPAAYSLHEDAVRITLETEALFVQIDKHPLRLSFFDTAGGLINADDKAFGTSFLGETVTTYKTLQPGERFVGLGEKTGSLDRRGSAYVNWNTDYFAYPIHADPLYTSVPFYMGIHGGRKYGIFFDNTHRSHFNFGAANNRFSSFGADAGSMDYYFFHGAGVAEILSDFTWIVGRMPLPPLWSLGYHQSRYSYSPDREAVGVARGLREKDIPADVIYLDIHHMDRYKVFTWDQARFPAPGRLIETLKQMDFRVVVIVDPGIKIETGYAPYESAKKRRLFLQYPDGTDYAGEVWPGWCHFPDFTNPETRRWWQKWLTTYTALGIEGIWCDMNEPAAWGHRVPDLVEFAWEGGGAAHRKARNVYGMQMAKATWEGVAAAVKKRPFVLSRSGFAGIQRYAAVWTGDNVADDAHMLADVRLVNSMGLSGMGFAGCDIGGFAGDADSRLFARWIAVGMFFPFARCHSAVNSRAAEPWAFGEAVEAVARNYIKLRYKLLPYIYACFYECSRTGLPVARSLVIDWPDEAEIYDPRYQHQYLFGPSILVAPVSSEKDMEKVYLPPGGWYDFYTDQFHSGPSKIVVETPPERLPLFVRAGAVIPMQPHAPATTSAPPGGPLQLHVYEGETADAFVYYEDDGESFDYEDGGYFRRQIRLQSGRLVMDEAEGGFASRYKAIEICFHGFDFVPDQTVWVNGRSRRLQSRRIRHCDSLSAADPRDAAADACGSIVVPRLTVANTAEAIEVAW
ncbi:MAG: glycoside hydrolase family 31 protein [Thermodesulfobacteriota bacterium]